MKQVLLAVLGICVTAITAQAEEVGYTLKTCENPSFHSHTIGAKTGTLDEKCMPDTLYSWGSFKKLERFTTTMTPENILPVNATYPIFTWRTPIGTFGYGQISVRIKLKPGTKFKLADSEFCSWNLSPEEMNDTVMVFPWDNLGSGVDFIICSSGPVQSWSYGTPEHKEEMLRELNWITNHSHSDYDLYLKNPVSSGSKEKNDSVLFGITADANLGTNWERAKLTDNLNLLPLEGSRVIFAKDQKEDRAEHFKTSKPIFFNPD